MKVNKFNIQWQIVRVKAKDFKHPEQKVQLVVDWLWDNKNIFNFHRVLNWLTTSKMGYSRDKSKQKPYLDAIHILAVHKDEFSSMVDSMNVLACEYFDDVVDVYNDLNQRKYNFQFNKTPQDHIDFVKRLEAHINPQEA